MSNALIDNLVYDSEEMKFYLQEKLILETTELIAAIMEEKGINKSELAKKLGRSKGYITQLLDGRANMTLRTISDVMWALDSSLAVNANPLGFEAGSKQPDFSTETKSHWQFPRKKLPKGEIEKETDPIRMTG